MARSGTRSPTGCAISINGPALFRLQTVYLGINLATPFYYVLLSPLILARAPHLHLLRALRALDPALCPTAGLIAAAEVVSGFAIDRAALDFFGVCRACANDEAPAAPHADHARRRPMGDTPAVDGEE